MFAILKIRPSALLLPLLFLAPTCQVFAFGKWTDWEQFTSRNGVDIYVRVFRPQKGWSLRAQWRAVNNNSQAMWVGFGKKEYHLDNGVPNTEPLKAATSAPMEPTPSWRISYSLMATEWKSLR